MRPYAMPEKRWLPKLGRPWIVASVLLLLLPYALSIGDEEATVFVSNSTAYYIHVFVSGQPFLYVSPRGSIQTQVGAPTTVVLEAVYSPGQGISGRAMDTDTVSLYRETVYTCTSCETNVSPSGDVVWDVTPAKMDSTNGNASSN
jgi:hypothetical protein